jgi:hypothetical protein
MSLHGLMSLQRRELIILFVTWTDVRHSFMCGIVMSFQALLVGKLGTASYALDFNYTKAYVLMLPFTVLAYTFARAIVTCIWFDFSMFVQMKLVWLLSTTFKWTDKVLSIFLEIFVYLG